MAQILQPTKHAQLNHTDTYLDVPTQFLNWFSARC